MKHTIKKFTAVFLALSLLAGMMTLFSTSVSAASDLTISVTSNLPDVFPASTIQVESGTKMVKVTYHINTPEYRIINCEWILEYDSTKLTPELKTGNLNLDLDESGANKSYRFMRFANNLSEQEVINTDPQSYRNREDGVRAIKGNITSEKGYNTVADEKREFVTAYFLINEGATGTAAVNLKLRTLQVCPKASAESSAVVGGTMYLVKNEVLQEKQVPQIRTILPQMDAPEGYESTAEKQDAPVGLGYSLALSDSIKVKVSVYNITEETAADYSVEVTYKGVTRTSDTDSSLKLKAIYKNELLLAKTLAPEMMEKAHLVIRDSNNNIIKSNDFSVLGYCEAMIAAPNQPEKYKNLCRAALNYGAECQKYFHVDETHLVNSNPDLGCDALALETVPETYKAVKTDQGNFNYGIKLSLYLTLDSETQMDITLIPGTGETMNQFIVQSFPPTGSTCSVETSTLSNGSLRIRIKNIVAMRLGDNITIQINGQNNSVRTYEVSPLSDAYSAQNAAQGNAAKGLYQFYKYAQLSK